MMIMQGAVTAVIAVAGTLLGSFVIYLFQRKTAQQIETSAFQRQLRSERAVVDSDFAKQLRRPAEAGITGGSANIRLAEGEPSGAQTLDVYGNALSMIMLTKKNPKPRLGR
jgi:hypothetical protein